MPGFMQHSAGFEQLATLQCNQRGPEMQRDAEQATAAGKVQEAYMMLKARELICTCMPERARQLRAAMPPAERDAPMTEDEFTQRYAPPLVHPCAASMARKMYGDDCAKLPVSAKASDGYCPCMRDVLDSMSDADVAQMGLESADWMPRAAEAKKAGQSEPEKPPLLRQFLEKEVACRK